MNIRFAIIIVLSMLTISCKNKPEQEPGNDSGLIEISKAQYEMEKMVIGKPELYSFADKVHFTGTIVPSSEGQAQISLPLPGIIDRVHCKPTQMVNKGTILFEVSGNWFINLQKDFAESSAILSKFESDYKRAKELYDESIGTEKEYTAAKSNYYAENAKYKALKKQLKNMGLNVSKIEENNFYSSFTVTSPINGYVSSINASIGQYIDPQHAIAEIIDNNSLQLKLSVFEKDLPKIESGQEVEFYFNGDETQKYDATLNAIGKTIMPDSKSIKCYAKINRISNISMVNNQFAEGEIITAVDSLWAVPETAILELGNDYHILRFENKNDSIYYFKKVKIKTGRKSNSYIEINEQLSSLKLLQSGIYNVVID